MHAVLERSRRRCTRLRSALSESPSVDARRRRLLIFLVRSPRVVVDDQRAAAVGKPSRHQSKQSRRRSVSSAPSVGAAARAAIRFASVSVSDTSDAACAPAARAAQCRRRTAGCCPRRPPRASAPSIERLVGALVRGPPATPVEELDQRAAKLFISSAARSASGSSLNKSPLETGRAYRCDRRRIDAASAPMASPTILERFQERDKIGLLACRQADVESLS